MVAAECLGRELEAVNRLWQIVLSSIFECRFTKLITGRLLYRMEWNGKESET